MSFRRGPSSPSRCRHTQGTYKAPLFTAKARVQAYVLEAHPRMTCIFPSFGMFYTNWVGSYPPTCARSQTMLSGSGSGSGVLSWFAGASKGRCTATCDLTS